MNVLRGLVLVYTNRTVWRMLPRSTNLLAILLAILALIMLGFILRALVGAL